MTIGFPQVPLTSICHPKQWPTLLMSQLSDSGYPVYGANGKIGYHSSFTHKEPTILITCRGATCGTLNISEPFAYVNGNAMALDNLELKCVDLMFLYFALRKRGLIDAISGTAQPQITRQNLEKVLVPLPPLPIQKQIAAILEKADAAREKRRKANQLTEQFLQSAFLEMFGDPVTNPKGWETSAMEEVCTKVADGTHFSLPMVDDGIPYITAKNVKKHGLDFYSNPTYISEDHHREIYRRCDPTIGDVVYIKDGVTTGIAAVNRYNFEFSMLSSLALLKPDKAVLTAEYLSAYLNTSNVKSTILRQMAGGAIKRLTVAKIKKLEILVPPLVQQQKFSALVEKVESLRAKQRESEKELENLFQSLMQRAFRGELYNKCPCSLFEFFRNPNIESSTLSE